VDAFVARCLAKSPGDRFQTMGAIIAELGSMLARRVPANEPPAFHMLPTTKVDVMRQSHWSERPAPAAIPPSTPQAPFTPTPRSPFVHESPVKNGTVYGAMMADSPIAAPRHMLGTTLGASVGQTTQWASRRPKSIRPWIAGLGALVFAAVLVVLLSSDGTNEDRAALSAARRPTTTPAAAVVAASTSSGTSAPALSPHALTNPPSVTPPAPAPQTADPKAASADMPASPPELPRTSPVELTARSGLHPGSPKPEHSRKRDSPVGASAAPGKQPQPVSILPAKPRSSTPTSCARGVFAATYNAATIAAQQVHAAMKLLKACHDAGDVSDVDFDEIQSSLVSRL